MARGIISLIVTVTACLNELVHLIVEVQAVSILDFYLFNVVGKVRKKNLTTLT